MILALLFSLNSFAAEVCPPLDMDLLMERFSQIRQEHAGSDAQAVLADFQTGLEFIRANMSPESKPYKMAETIFEEFRTMTLEELLMVEDLRIQIIPVLGIDQIYGDKKDLLLKDCRPNLLAAFILT
jgi:hypothetical protein